MKQQQIFLYSLLTILVTEVTAQDSLKQFLPTAQLMSKYHFFNRQVISHPLSRITNYSAVEAGYAHIDGEFIQRQDAPVQRSMNFSTEGTRQMGKWLLSGAFSFSRDTKDSVIYTLHEGVPNSNPYYFFSGSRGNWDINRYALQGILSRSFFNDGLLLSVGGNYQTLNAWRTNDPRTDQFDHSMKIDIGLNLKISEHHRAGFSGGLGLDATENSNDYRNKDYQYNLQYMERINYIQYGYGLNVIQSSNRSIVSDAPQWNIRSVYQAIVPAIGTVTLKGGYFSKKTDYFRRATSTDDGRFSYGSFDEHTVGWDGLWESKSTAKGQWILSASYSRTEGKDFHPVLNGNNYVYHQEGFNASPSYLHKKNEKPLYEVSLRGAYNDLSRTDGSSSHFVRYKSFTSDITGSGYWHLKERRVLKFTAGLGVTSKIDADLQVPESQETEFSRQVVYYDYYYYSAGVVNTNAELAYYFPVKRITAFGKFLFKNQNASLVDRTVAAVSLPGNRRTVWQFSIGLGL